MEKVPFIEEDRWCYVKLKTTKNNYSKNTPPLTRETMDKLKTEEEIETILDDVFYIISTIKDPEFPQTLG